MLDTTDDSLQSVDTALGARPRFAGMLVADSRWVYMFRRETRAEPTVTKSARFFMFFRYIFMIFHIFFLNEKLCFFN